LVDTWKLLQEVFAMGKTHVPYPPEIRRQMVELVRAGREPQDLSREFEPSAQAIRNWARQAECDQGRGTDGLSTDERAELTRLRRENRQLRLERDIGPKAAAWFARETGTIPSGSSNS
jgi:transposase